MLILPPYLAGLAKAAFAAETDMKVAEIVKAGVKKICTGMCRE